MSFNHSIKKYVFHKISKLSKQNGYDFVSRNNVLKPLEQNFLEGLTASQKITMSLFRNPRYYLMNELRWRAFLQMGISLEGLTVFEPGAGVGDQTEWLLRQGVSKVIVNEGRDENLSILRHRFDGEPRVKILKGNLQEGLPAGISEFTIDLVFLWGVYYHLNDGIPEFPLLHQLSKISSIVVFDYLESPNGVSYVENYSSDKSSKSIALKATRPSEADLIRGLTESFGYAYFPVNQLDYFDPDAPLTPRKLVIGTSKLLTNKWVEQKI
jgi:hypothetical protein